jgi:hypothetical protein
VWCLLIFRAPRRNAIVAQIVAASALFTVTDADNDSIARYQLWDSTGNPAGGHWAVNGVAQGANQTIRYRRPLTAQLGLGSRLAPIIQIAAGRAAICRNHKRLPAKHERSAVPGRRIPRTLHFSRTQISWTVVTRPETTSSSHWRPLAMVLTRRVLRSNCSVGLPCGTHCGADTPEGRRAEGQAARAEIRGVSAGYRVNSWVVRNSDGKIIDLDKQRLNSDEEYNFEASRWGCWRPVSFPFLQTRANLCEPCLSRHEIMKSQLPSTAWKGLSKHRLKDNALSKRSLVGIQPWDVRALFRPSFRPRRLHDPGCDLLRGIKFLNAKPGEFALD